MFGITTRICLAGLTVVLHVYPYVLENSRHITYCPVSYKYSSDEVEGTGASSQLHHLRPHIPMGFRIVFVPPESLSKALRLCNKLNVTNSIVRMMHYLRTDFCVTGLLNRLHCSSSTGRVLPNSTDKFRGVIVGSIGSTNNRRTWGRKQSLTRENRERSRDWEDDDSDKRD
ncbi:hypothetical protein TNCV_351441 [Trichonephila clavipes]|nr:hypothetical protein TNCV_351441 [Trichonephila clavipes]